VIGLLVCLILMPVAWSQAISLSPQQQAMLNQLPPAQRQEAMRAIEQLQRQNGGGELSSLSEEEVNSAIQGRRLSSPDDVEEEDEPRAAGGSPLIVTLTPSDDLSNEDEQGLQEDRALQGVQGSRFYELNQAGVLELPGLPSVLLLGLDEEQAAARLAAEPALGLFDITVSLLDTPVTGRAALEPFGYDVFEDDEYGFDPVSTGPVPSDYVLGPGDSVRVQLFGNVNEIYEFEVSRDGVLNLPELGPVTVAGLPFSEFRADINRRVQEMLIGTQVSVTMGRLRTIRVFVVGDAKRPGSYVVSSLATISSALYASGGVSGTGTLRDIQLKRSGRIVGRLDLYDLLLNGDTSGDSRLQPGDAVFIPPVGAQVSVSGAVKRPAIYETEGDESIADVIAMAGGTSADAFPEGVTVERIESGQKRRVLAVELGSSQANATQAMPGDAITVPDVLPELEDTVTLSGHVNRPGPYQWRSSMRLVDLVGSLRTLQPGADSQYVLIRRESADDRRVAVLSANLGAALTNPSSPENIELRPRDTVYVFSKAFGRQRVIEPLLEELQLQARYGQPYREVSVSGEVQAPGTYPLEPGMRISDLIRAGGSLSEEAYSTKAELVRYDVVGNEYRNTEVVDIDLESILRGDASADVVLQEHDNLRISGLPDWDTLWTVSLDGEVTFPGEYRIRQGETLSQLLERAGGLTDSAFAEGAIFLRESLRLREQEQIEILARRLESDLTSLSLAADDLTGPDTLATGQALLEQLRETEAVGRLVIDLETLLGRAAGENDVELRDGDTLLVPKMAQEVTVLGEVQQTTSHLYQPGLARDDYIALSGGLTRRADRKLIYIVRASGAVVAGGRSKWFARGGSASIRPGDTVVVPLETDRVRPLTLWTNVTQILYQAAIAVAAIDTFGR